MKGDRSFYGDESEKSNREAVLQHMVRCGNLREICETMAELAGDVTDPSFNDRIPKDDALQAKKVGDLAKTAMALVIETVVRHRKIDEKEIAKRIEEAAGPAIIDLSGKD
jgi:hypothetical protein